MDMDFDKLNTKADAEAGALLHYTHPQLGHPLYTGEGSDEYGRLVDPSLEHIAVQALVRGTESDVVRAAVSRSGSNTLKGVADDKEAYAFAASLIIELFGVVRDGKPVKAAPADIRWFFGRSEDFALQTINFAKERSNFFGASSKV
jgi:hypothetical protein